MVLSSLKQSKKHLAIWSTRRMIILPDAILKAFAFLQEINWGKEILGIGMPWPCLLFAVGLGLWFSVWLFKKLLAWFKKMG
jgi:hypothetical protein